MIKIVSIAIVCAILVLYLKSINSDLAMPTLILSGILIIFYAINYLSSSFEFIRKIIESSGLDNDIISAIFKITAIGYVIDFGADAIEDFGLKSLSNKLIFAGKIVILTVSLPIIYAVFNIINGLFQ